MICYHIKVQITLKCQRIDAGKQDMDPVSQFFIFIFGLMNFADLLARIFY